MKTIILILVILFLIWPCGAKEYFVLGEPEGDGEILTPTEVKEGPDGNIYVYDLRVAFIKVFSPQGNFLRKMGGKGQGPGEIQRTDDVSFNFTYDGKLLYFTEYFSGHRWITFMELSGKFHHVVKLKMKQNYAISNSLQLKDGSFLADVSFLCQSQGKKDYYISRCPKALMIISPSGELVSEILRTNHLERISMIPFGGDLGIPYTPLFQWVLLKNNSIVFTEGLTQLFKIYDMKGKITGEIKPPVPQPQLVTDKDLEDWRQRTKNRFRRDEAWFNEFGRVVYKYDKSVHKMKPNINSISSTPGSNLLIAGLWNLEKNSRPYWLMDLQGNAIKTIEITAPIYSLMISEHFIFAKFSDEDGNTLILCFKRTGTEADDLARVARLDNLIVDK
jgi:hypothetical protein